MITLSKPVQQIVNEFKVLEAQRGALWKNAERLDVMDQYYFNTRETLDGGRKWIRKGEAEKQGRYSEDAQKSTSDPDYLRHGNYMILVDMTVEEIEGRRVFIENRDKMNALYEEYKTAQMVVDLRSGKRMQSRFAGKSALTGAEFPAGTEIFYTNTLRSGKIAAPAVEVQSIA